MGLAPKGVPEEVVGSLESCLVEGDPDERRREARIHRRALLFSIVLQTVVVASLVLLPLLGKSERFTYEHTIIPPYAPLGAAKHNTGRPSPATGRRKVCIVCFHQHLPTIKLGERLDTTLKEPEGDSIPGASTSPGGNGGMNIDPSSRLPEPPRTERPQEPVRRLRLTLLEPALLTHRIEPVYPPLARQLRREGRVELRAIIATDGTIQSLEALSGDPLFYQSALEAVRQWRYRATILNGQAVEIDTHITVIYTLNR
jgi:TonB family protein